MIFLLITPGRGMQLVARHPSPNCTIIREQLRARCLRTAVSIRLCPRTTPAVTLVIRAA